VLATESQLSAMGGDDLGDDLARSESLRERGRGLASLLAERKRGIERDRRALVDQAVIATLEAESSRLVDELAEVEAEAHELAPAGKRLVEVEGELGTARGALRGGVGRLRARGAKRWCGRGPRRAGRAARWRGSGPGRGQPCGVAPPGPR